MPADIIKGVYFKIEGKAGETKGIAWSILQKMGSHLQHLISAMAKYDLANVGSPQLNNFEIELFDYRPGSAVPAFRLRPVAQQVIGIPIQEQRQAVSKSFDSMLEIAAGGDYRKIGNLYTLPEVKNEIAKQFFEFVNSPGQSPITVVRPTPKGRFTKVYNIQRFTQDAYNYLYTPTLKTKIISDTKSEDAYGKVLLKTTKGKTKPKIVELYRGKDNSMSFSPSHIVVSGKTYNLHGPLMCVLDKEKDYFVIENKLMDLYASGESEYEAEQNFYKEFDLAFTRLNELSDAQLSTRLIRAKALMNLIVKEIIIE